MMSTKQLIISLLLNLFALPGAGHFYLKQKKRAWLFFTPVILLIVGSVGHFEYLLITQLRAATNSIDLMQKANTISASIMKDQGVYFSLYTALLVLVYILSTLDLIRIYRTPKDAPFSHSKSSY